MLDARSLGVAVLQAAVMLVPFGAAGAQAPAKAPAKVEGAKAAKPRKVGGPVLAVIPPDAAPLRTVLVSADGSRLVRFTEDDRVVFGVVADYLSRNKKQRTKNETRYRYALKAPLLSPRGDLLVARAADAVTPPTLDHSFLVAQLNHQQIVNQLASIGVKPEEIDIVVNSHLHFDHCSNNKLCMEFSNRDVRKTTSCLLSNTATKSRPELGSSNLNTLASIRLSSGV